MSKAKQCYQCEADAAFVTDSGVPLCPQCYPKPEEKPLRINADDEFDRMRKELADDFDDDKHKTPRTITKPWWERITMSKDAA